MSGTLDQSPVVAIGGMGGSGTRLIAAIIEALGINIGSILNGPLDNLAFTFFLKRPAWFRSFPTDGEIIQALDLFHAHMIGNKSKLDKVESRKLFAEIVDGLNSHPQPVGADEITGKKILQEAQRSNGTEVQWGWKEPNTHIFLPQIIERYPKIKYIHVVRHGLDMAFSQNQQQLTNWGNHLTPQDIDSSLSLPSRSLDFWITSTKRAISIGKNELGENFLLLNYDAFCQTPEESVEEILSFMEIDVTDDTKKQLQGLFAPSSIGRFRDHDLGQFSNEQLETVSKLGFDIV
ncbi:MAG: sulfotransferase [Rhizobiaceae bacterium]|nr:sulfotransferase [Rhizobiaceae bacterium]